MRASIAQPPREGVNGATVSMRNFRPSPALVVAIAALVVALAGVAYATILDSMA
jgi:hypothetical protein